MFKYVKAKDFISAQKMVFRGQKRDFGNDQKLIEAFFRQFIWYKELLLGEIGIWQ